MGSNWLHFDVNRSEWLHGCASWPKAEWPADENSVFGTGIGLGTAGFRTLDDEGGEAHAVLQHAIRSGIRVIDTATNYGDGFSEVAIGAAVRSTVCAGVMNRDGVAVISKAGYLSDREGGGPFHSLAPAFLRRQIAASRRRMGLQTIDAYLLHNVEEQIMAGRAGWTTIPDAFGALEEEAAAGHIGCYGVAAAEGFLVGDPGYHSLPRLLHHATEAGGMDNHFRVIELPVSLWRREAFSTTPYTVRGRSASILDVARDAGLIVLGSIPLGHKKDAGQAARFLRTLFPQTQIESSKMMALQFARSVPGVHVVLPGISKLAHLMDAVAVMRIPRWELASV